MEYFGLRKYLASLNEKPDVKVETVVKRFNFFIVRCDNKTVAVKTRTKAIVFALYNNGQKIEEVCHASSGDNR